MVKNLFDWLRNSSHVAFFNETSVLAVIVYLLRLNLFSKLSILTK